MKLAAYLNERKITYRDFASQVGCDASQIHRWAAGKRLPSLVMVSRIKRATDDLVTADDFESHASDLGNAAGGEPTSERAA